MKLEDFLGKFKKRSHPLEIVFHKPKEKTAFSEALFEIAAAFSEKGGIELIDGNGENLPGVPALTVGGASSGPVNYMALPEGREEGPFLDMLTWKLEEDVAIAADLKASLQKLEQPACIWVFIAPGCPNCPNAVRAANTLACLSPAITSTIIDAAVFPDLAGQFNVQSVPMTVVNGDLLINEVVTAEALASKILSQHTDQYLEDVFLSQLKTGNFDEASKRLLEQRQTVSFFLSAWEASTLSDRMALMLVAKQVLEQNPKTLDTIVRGLIEILKTGDVSLKGDTADLLGQIGHKDAKKPLEHLLQYNNDDIVEIAEDALKHLEERRKQ